MSQLVEILLTNLGAIAIAVVTLWAASVLMRDASIADVFWGVGFILIAGISFAVSDATAGRVWLLCVLVTIWGVRLTSYLLWRKFGEGEDRRYAAMRRRRAHRFWWWSLFSVFLLQGGILWFVALPIQFAAWRDDQTPLAWLDGSGIVLWLVGFTFESIGDWQLARFKSKPENDGRVMDQGLWRYTRHPNYFGDFCVWWGLYLIAAAGGAAFTILSPALMSLLLLKVSGIGMLEATIADRRPEYAHYKRRTHAFIPSPPRRA